MDNSFATGEPDPRSDVALAWKSLQKAKAVLQRIENKFYHQTWSCAKSQADRRKLWHEESFEGKKNRDEIASNEKKSNEIPPAHRKGSGAAWSQTHFLVSSGPSEMTPLSCGEDSRSAHCSAACREAEDGEGTARTWCPAKSLHRARRDDFREQAGSRDRTGQKGKSPCSLHHLPHSPERSSPFSAVPCESRESNYLLPTHHFSPASKLEELRKKSPGNKLEQLKKRIQEQKKKQQASSQEPKCPNSAYARETLPEQCQKCKVASAPPAPVYRGFSDMNLRSALSLSDEEYRILGRGKFTIPDQRRIYKKASNIPVKEQRERNSAQRIQMQSQRQPSPASSVLGRAVTGKGAKLPGASAWREGQKLARKLLGPRPAFPNARSTAKEQTTANTFEPSRGFLAVPVMESSSRGKENEPAWKNSEFQNCVIPPSKTIGRGSNVPTKDTKQILRDLHLQSPYHDEHRHIPKYTTQGKAEVLQQYVGIHSPSPGPWGISPFAFSGKKIKPSLMKDGAKPSTSGNCMRRKSTSQRQKGSIGLAQKGSEKENLKYPSSRRVNIKRSHPYSPEIVREFMYRKNEERRKKILEEKKSLAQAREMRNKRLQEVYRKQREAVGKKTCSDQMHKLIMETASGKESPHGELEQEEICGGILEKNFVPWMHKTSCTLLSKDRRDSNQLETVRSPKKRKALPSQAPLEPECWFLSPLKCEDLKDCTHPAPPTPPLSFSLPRKDAEPYSKSSTSGLSPSRNNQDRVKAIHKLCKELAEKIEMATKRLNSAGWIKNSCDKTSSETTLDIYNTSSSVPEPKTSKEEQDRTMTIRMLLDTPDPAVLRVSSDGEFQGLGRISLVGGTKGATALEKMKEIPTPSPGGSAATKELPWVPHGTGQRHGESRGEPSDPLQGFPVNKGSRVDISLLHEKPITSPASPSHRFLTRSLQGELAAQRNRCQSETILKVQNEEEIATQSHGESLRTPDSLQLQPSAALSPGAETHDSTERDFGEGDPSYAALQAKHRSCLANLREISLLLAREQKVHQLRQKQQLATLGEKTELEVQESQRFWSNLLQHKSRGCSSSKGSYPVPRLDHAEQTWRGYQVEDDYAAGRYSSNLEMKQSSLKTQRDHSPVDPKIGERKRLGRSGSYRSGLREESLPVEHRELLHDHPALNLLPPPMNLPHMETGAGDDSGESSQHSTSDSQWSEVGWHYGDSGSFCQFSLDMVEQYLRGEELRARYQAALLKLRKKALQEKARAELAWLGHQKRCLEKLQDSKGASAIAAKQDKILMELQEEKAEIQHLQNICRAAHQERKFLLKQQNEILMMQDSAAKLQEKLRTLAEKQEPTRSPATEAMKLRTKRLISSPKLSFSSAESTAHPERPELLENRGSCVPLKNKQSKEYEGFSTENKKSPVQHKKQAEESPGLEQSLGVQGPDVFEMVTEKLCGATSQTTGSLFMIKDCKTTEHNVRNHVILPLEHANSTRMDESIPTPTTKEGKKCAFLESVLEEKALISNPEIDPKDNEDIKPCDSKFPAKGLETLSALCNLCLVQAENSLQGTVEEVEVPVPYEIHQVDGSQCLKHLEHISHEASDEELNLKAFSEGLASTESSSKSNNFSLRCQSAKSDSSLPEFQKVSAVWIDILESSISDSELELENGKDTDVSIPEEFVCDDGDVFPNVSEETLTAVSKGKEMFPSDNHNEREVPKDDSAETSSHSQKYPGDVSDHGCTDGWLSFIPSDKANASETMSADSTQPDNPAKGMDEPHLDAFENNSRNKTSSQKITKQGKDAVASSSYSDDIYSSETYEKQKASSTTSGVKNNGGINSLFVGQNRELIGFSLTGSLEHVDLVTDQVRNTVSFPPDKDITNNRLLACLSSRNLLVSGGKNNHAQLSNEVFESSKLNKVVCLSMSVPAIPQEAHTETNSFESLKRVVTGNANNSTAERQAIKEERKGLLSSVSSEERLFQAENCSSKGEDDTIFIGDEGLPPTDEDTLSEILSPVDEVLSYGSADLPPSNKKDLSFPSEDLPPPPLSADAMKNDDSTFTTDDFPSPPEQMTVLETRQCMDEDISLKMDALSPSPENTVPEEFPLLNPETTDAFSTRDGIPSEQSLVKYSIAKKGLLEYQQGEHETPLQHLGFQPVASPVFSGQASKSPDFTMQRCKTYSTLHKGEEDGDDPLLSFAIGDRVLVKQTQPGTLMFKGQTCFDSGHWAGVALDKAEGDNAGTYKGVKYFECAQQCGIFVRPDEISHLLGANKNGSNHTEGEDSDSFCDDESFKRDSKYSEDDEHREGFTEQKAEDTNSEGGSEVKENQSRLHSALLSGKGQKLPHSHQSKCNEFLCQNNLTCLGSDKEKTELTQIKKRILADVLPVKSKTSNTDEVNRSKNICCLVEDQKRNKFPDDISSELSKKLLFDTLIAFSERAQHKYKNAFEKDMLNYDKGLREEDNQKLFLLKENSVALLPEQSAKVSGDLLCDFNMLSFHGCHTVAERIVTKFVDDAVKEYKKIKRKHPSKADKTFHSSSETSPSTLPFLRKILDAGVFGSSEDFDQPNSDQHMLVKQTQKQYTYKSDQWHSAPWKKTVEVPLVIPHHSSYVKELSAYAVEELWTPENINSNFRGISVPKYFECNDLPGNDLETESKRMYNQVIFDLTRELLCAEYQVTANPNTFPWMKENLGSHCSRHLCRRDVSEVKTFVQGEIIKILNLEKNDLEMKRHFLNMTKYGNCKRDRVDLILIQELHKEESQWTTYDDDELTVKMRMTEDIFDSLILDTIRVLNEIHLRKACE